VRSADDPRVVEALDVLGQVFDGDRAHPETRHERSDVHEVLNGKWLEAFTFDGWPEPSVRAVMLALLQHAPDEDFDALLGAVRAEARWQVHYRRLLAADARLRRRHGRVPSPEEVEAEAVRPPLHLVISEEAM
jgi:hypothetical protein